MNKYTVDFKCADGEFYNNYEVIAKNETEVINHIKERIKDCAIIQYIAKTTNGWGNVTKEENRCLNMGSIVYFTIK